MPIVTPHTERWGLDATCSPPLALSRHFDSVCGTPRSERGDIVGLLGPLARCRLGLHANMDHLRPSRPAVATHLSYDSRDPLLASPRFHHARGRQPCSATTTPRSYFTTYLGSWGHPLGAGQAPVTPPHQGAGITNFTTMAIVQIMEFTVEVVTDASMVWLYKFTSLCHTVTHIKLNE